MKKWTMIIITIFMIFILSSCGQKEKNEIKIFLQQLQIDQIKNTYEISEGVYSVFLSDHTPFIYYTYTTVEYIVIVVREERSFAYLLDDTSYNDIRHMYVFNRTNYSLYFHNDSELLEITVLENDELEHIVDTVKNHLNQTGSLLTFDSLYLMIKQFYSNFEANQLEVHGQINHGISISYSNQHFLSTFTQFGTHLTSIYRQTKAQLILSSIEQNVYQSVVIRLQWNSTNHYLYPILYVSRNQLVFYRIDPTIEDYHF